MVDLSVSVLALLRLHELSASLKSCSLKTACVHGFGFFFFFFLVWFGI